ncbi:MAG: type II CRISPR-associated endonuclease Cas1 [Bacteroidetes bacterium]|nr:type II CRISPR-associated endonuclease Cas1 [Bacteroidota bacterium]
MIKRTLYFGNPAYLSLKNGQMAVRLPDVEKNENISETGKEETRSAIPVEDIGIVVMDNRQITVTQGLIAALLENNAALIACDNTHLPAGLLLNLSGNHVQTEKFKAQIEASLPLKKQLWQQTVQAKIRNQAALLKRKNMEVENMERWADDVQSGDIGNLEARAAAYYWKNIFSHIFLLSDDAPGGGFFRDRNGPPPNNLLNYGYAILRATVARGLVASGLLPTLGIHHHNKYNAYCLADDIMEPYRPFVDEIVLKIAEAGENFYELSKEIKTKLLNIPALDIMIDGQSSPLMVGLQRTTASLAGCFEGVNKKIIYPTNEE